MKRGIGFECPLHSEWSRSRRGTVRRGPFISTGRRGGTYSVNTLPVQSGAPNGPSAQRTHVPCSGPDATFTNVRPRVPCCPRLHSLSIPSIYTTIRLLTGVPLSILPARPSIHSTFSIQLRLAYGATHLECISLISKTVLDLPASPKACVGFSRGQVSHQTMFSGVHRICGSLNHF